jgi:WD40 repeat protein/serine/threonine protein kinase
LLRELGRGGMGVVYEAEQVSLGRKVALKILPTAATLDPRRLQRFQNEARAAAALHHTNIVPVFAVGSEHGVHFYAMQMIEGQTLAGVLRELRGPAGGRAAGQQAAATGGAEQTTAYPPPDPAAGAPSTAPQGALSTTGGVGSKDYVRSVARVGVQAAEALDYAHQLGVVHRDVKPGNLMVDGRGQLWVTDFGLAQFKREGEQSLTLTGDLIGTLRYMSPEQALAKQVPVDHRTDVYALGATLYELLTLQPVFAGSDRQELLRQIACEDPRALRRLNRAVPVELETVIHKALEKDPADRYATAQALADDLRRFLDDRPILARRPSWWQRLRKWAWRRRDMVGTALGSLLVLLALGVAGLAYGLAVVEGERDKASRRGDEAKAAQHTAETQRDAARAQLYVARARLAGQSWERGDIERLEEILNSQVPRQGEPDLRGWEWHYLHALCGRALLTFGAATSGYQHCVVNPACLAWSPDGQRLASAGIQAQDTSDPPVVVYSSNTPSTVKIWDLVRRRELFTLQGHPRSVTSLAWSPDGTRLASANGDRTITIWDAATGKERCTLRGHAGPGASINCVAWGADGTRLASTSADGLVLVWDVGTRQVVRTLRGHHGDVLSATWSPDGTRLASVGKGDKAVRIWDVAAGRQVCAIDVSPDPVRAVSWAPGGDRLVISDLYNGPAGKVKVWDGRTGQVVLTLPTGAGTPAKWSPDGKWLAALCPGGALTVWDARTGEQAFTLGGSLYSPAWSPDGRHLAACVDWQNRITVWDAVTRQEVLSVRGRHARWLVGWSPDGRYLLSGGIHTYQVWDATSGQEMLEFQGHTDAVSALAWGPDGRRLASASRDRTAKIWDANTGEDLLTLRGAESGLTAVAWSPEGKYLATGEGARTQAPAKGRPHAYGASPPARALVRIWEAATGAEVAILPGHGNGEVYHLAFSPDGRRLASLGSDRFLRVWDVARGKETWALTGDVDVSAGLSFSPDGKFLATAGARIFLADGRPREFAPGSPHYWRPGDSFQPEVVLRDSETGSEVRRLQGHTNAIHCVAFGPKGSLLASGSKDRTIRLWDTATGQTVRVLTGFAQGVEHVAFSPDGKRLVSRSTTTSGLPEIKIWDVVTGQELLTLGGISPGDATEYASCFSPDGLRLAAAGPGSTVKIRDAAPRPAVLFANPRHPRHPWYLRNHYWSLAAAAGADFDAADSAYRKAIGFQERLVGELPHDLARRHELGLLHLDLGELLRDGDRPAEAEKAFRSAIACLQPLQKGFPVVRSYRQDLGRAFKGLSALFQAAGRGRDYGEALGQIVTLTPDSYEDCKDYAWLLATSPDPKQRDPKRAVALARQAIERSPWKDAVPGRPLSVPTASLSAGYRNTLAVAYYRAGDREATIATVEPLLADRVFARVTPPASRLVLAMAHAERGGMEKARSLYSEAVRLMDQAGKPDEDTRRLRAEAAHLLGLGGVTTPGTREAPPRK